MRERAKVGSGSESGEGEAVSKVLPAKRLRSCWWGFPGDGLPRAFFFPRLCCGEGEALGFWAWPCGRAAGFAFSFDGGAGVLV